MFHERYVSYAHFRSKGWIPRPGAIGLGFDYLLYDGVLNSAMAACTDSAAATADSSSGNKGGHDHAK